MIRLRYLTLLVLAVLIVVSTVPLVSSDVLRGEFTVPNWVKNTAGWWASDQIPDSTNILYVGFNSGVSGIKTIIPSRPLLRRTR